jgi:hypothetical protein
MMMMIMMRRRRWGFGDVTAQETVRRTVRVIEREIV